MALGDVMLMKQLAKAVGASVVAMPVATALWFALLPLGTFPAPSGKDLVEGFLFLSLITSVYGLIVSVAYAVPLFFLARRLGIANVFTCLLAAVAPWFVFSAFAGDTPDKYVLFLIHSIVGAIAFWLFARHVRNSAQQGTPADPPRSAGSAGG